MEIYGVNNCVLERVQVWPMFSNTEFLPSDHIRNSYLPKALWERRIRQYAQDEAFLLSQPRLLGLF